MTITTGQLSLIVCAVEAINEIASGEVDDINCKIATFIKDNGDNEGEQLAEFCAIPEVAASNCDACQTTGAP